MMTQPLPHRGATMLQNPRLKELKGSLTSHYASSSTKLSTAFEQGIYGCCSWKEKHEMKGTLIEMPSADCTTENLNSASISDELLEKINSVHNYLTCMQATGNSVEFTSPNGDLGPSHCMPPYTTKAF